MNTPVSFELAKLLKEKGFDGNYFHYWNMVNHSGEWKVDTSIWEYTDNYIEAPTIAEVVMWLYEKHEYWCYVYTNGKIWHPCIQHKFGDMAVLSGKIGESNSPTEAYEAAIEYTLNNLI